MQGKVHTTGRADRQKASSPSFRQLSPLTSRSIHHDQVAGAEERRGVAIDGAVHRVRAALSDGYSVILACDPSLEGTLGAVGIAYLAHASEESVRLAPREGCQRRFGEQLVETPKDADDEMVALAQRVYRGIERHVVEGCPRSHNHRCPTNCASACARRLVYAAASDSPTMPDVVHRYVRLAFAEGARMRSLIAEDRVVEVDELARSVLSECEHTKQFTRFSLLSDGSLFAVFRPKADTIPLTAGYFAARMGGERFCLVDPLHRSAAFHDSGSVSGRRGYVVTKLDQESADLLARTKDLSPDERYVRALWKRFYDAVTLPGRDASQRGYDLRAGWMPKRFWGNLTELDPRSDDRGNAVPQRYAGKEAPAQEQMRYSLIAKETPAQEPASPHSN